jgi:lysozyme
MMIDREKLARQLILHEGMSLRPYKDTVGKLTIGVGRNLEDVGITEEEALFLLRTDITRVITVLDATFPWFRFLDDVRQRVLADMCFNLGVSGLLKFRKTLELVEARRYKEAAEEMLNSLWAKQVGGRAVRLAKMMETGLDQAQEDQERTELN